MEEIVTSTQIKEKGMRLKRLRFLAGLRRIDVAQKHNINYNTLKSWELSGYKGISKKNAERIIAVYEKEGVICSVEWLLYGIGSGPRVIELKEYTDETVSLVNEEKQIIRELMFFRGTYPNSVEFIVNDDGMEPYFFVGDYVAGIIRKEKEIDQVVGRICIIKTSDEKVMVRFLDRGLHSCCYKIRCLNLKTKVKDSFPENVKIKFAAEVIWFRRKFCQKK